MSKSNEAAQKCMPYHAKRTGDKERVRLTILIDKRISQRLKKMVRQEKASMSYLVNRMIAKELNEPIM